MMTHGRAREVASWWQSPGSEGRRFAEFASTGAVSDISGLLADIEREQTAAKTHEWFWLNELHKYIDHNRDFVAKA